jgi:hypothetical protein
LALAVAAFALAAMGAGLISVDHAAFGEGRKSPRKFKEKD